MTHLAPQEVIDALEDTLDPARAAHLEGCRACQREVSASGSVLREMSEERQVPEPSPLFWDHFGRRVRVATDSTAVGRSARWSLGWKTLTGLGMVAASLMLIVTLRSGPGSVTETPTLADAVPVDEVSAASIAELLATELEPWAVVADAASELSVADLGALPVPAPGSAELLVDALTPEERAELVRLLQAEMGGGE